MCVPCDMTMWGAVSGMKWQLTEPISCATAPMCQHREKSKVAEKLAYQSSALLDYSARGKA